MMLPSTAASCVTFSVSDYNVRQADAMSHEVGAAWNTRIRKETGIVVDRACMRKSCNLSPYI
jgi:hypothetical protein